MPLLLALDLGTSHLKAHAFTLNGQELAACRRRTPMAHPRPGWGEMVPEDLWQNCVALLRELGELTAGQGTPVALAITSVGEAGVPLDSQGVPVFASIAWYDTRAQPQKEKLEARFGMEAVFEATGQALHPIFGLCKLLWLQEEEPTVFSRIRHWLSLAGYIGWRLSGVMAMEYSLAARTMSLDVARNRWADEFLSELGLSVDIFPPLVAAGEPLGHLLPEVAKDLNLPGNLLVAAGGHDHVVAALALGVTGSTTLLDSMGSAEGLFLPLPQPATNQALGVHGISQGRHVAGGFYLMAGLYTSGVVVDWFCSRFAPGKDYAEMMATARQVSAGSQGVVFLPHLRLANPGHQEQYSRGSYIGMTMDTTVEVMFRATLEGLAMEARYSLDQVLRLSGMPWPEGIVLTGGGTRNRLWLEIKAAVMNRSLQVAHMEEAAALGAALLAGVGVGHFPTVHAAAKAIELQSRTLAPREEEVQVYEPLYLEVYRKLCKSLSPLHEAIHRLQALGTASKQSS